MPTACVEGQTTTGEAARRTEGGVRRAGGRGRLVLVVYVARVFVVGRSIGSPFTLVPVISRLSGVDGGPARRVYQHPALWGFAGGTDEPFGMAAYGAENLDFTALFSITVVMLNRLVAVA